MNGGYADLRDLPRSVRLVIDLMRFEHLVNGRQYLTFMDIVRGTGLSLRTTRRVLSMLKEMGIVRVVIDVSRSSRKYLYQLVHGRVPEANSAPGLPSGLYLVDLGVGVTQHMTFKMYRVIRSSKIIYYTKSVPRRVLDFASYDAKVVGLDEVDVDKFKDEVTSLVRKEYLVSVLYDFLIDKELVKKYVEHLSSDGLSIYHVFGMSPLHVAVSLLHQGIERTVCYKRGNMIIKVFTSRGCIDVRSEKPVKAFCVRMDEHGVHLREIGFDEMQRQNDDSLKAYIVYYLRS